MDDRVRELYRLDPGEFVAARGQLAKQVRAEGDPALAAEIAALRRPTVAAWGLNLLADAAPEQITELLAVGVELARAQRRAAADRLRELAVRRRTIVAALTRTAAQAAASHGRTLSDSVLREITETLQAALADPETAESVRTGTVSAATSYSGFGPMGPGLAAVPKPPAAEPKSMRAAPKPGVRAAPAAAGESAPGPPDLESARAAADLAAARAAAAQARADVESLRAQSNRNATERTELDAEITALRTRLSTAQDRRKFLIAAAAATRKSLLQAEHALDAAEQRLSRADPGHRGRRGS